MPNVPDYSQYVAVKKIATAQTANANTSIVKGRAPYRFDGYFPMYNTIRLPVNALISNKFTSSSAASAAPPVPFAPSDLASLFLWLDSSSLTNGASISTWTDKTASAKAFSAVGGPTPVVSQIGGLNYINMTGGGTGTNGYYSAATFNFPAQYSIFAVGYTARGNTPVPGDGHIAALMNAGDFTNYMRRTSNSFDILYGNGVGAPWYTTVGYLEGSTTTPRIYEFVQNNSGSGTANLYINGVSRGSGTGLTIARTNFGLTIGGRGDSQTWGGYLGEFLLFNAPLTTTDRQKVEGYMAWKWSLSSDLPADHPYKTAAPV
jgi:hypothetical protein